MNFENQFKIVAKTSLGLEEVLAEEGITDLEKYRVDSSVELLQDLFL